MNEFSSDICHEQILTERKPLLAFDENTDYALWRSQVSEKLKELLGDMPEEKVPLNIRIEWEEDKGDYIEKRFVFDTERDTSVPCHLLIPKKSKKPCPVIICLQGHSTGMHISLGRPIYEKDYEQVKSGDRDFAIQAVREGYAALVMEQRGFGERLSEKSWIPAIRDFHEADHTGCYHPSMVALLLGRTLIGERVWDVSRAIDALETFSGIDSERIACMGNSGGGTATYYAACMDERIKIAMPSCSVCTFIESIGIMRHCSCNYIPRMAKYFEMGELSCMIAPRKLVVVAGEKDHGFYIKGSLEAYNTIEQIYKKAGCPENCKLVVGEEGHRFYADPSWEVFRKLADWD